ncbi:MAG TPA: hypothetical protein VGM86_24660 [Thermoanaerobaculia bacterium]|jgi:hypothetical protein
MGHDPQHGSAVNNLGQPLHRILQDIIYDPFVQAELDDSGGDLLVHYQTPLLDGNDVYMEFKGGTFTTALQWETQDWIEKKLTWQGGNLVTAWSYTSSWKPVPFASLNTGVGPFWEPVFHPVMAGNYIYVPAAQGKVVKLRKSDGSVAATINPFPPTTSNATDTFVASPLSADQNGNIYYNAIRLSHSNPWEQDVVDSWLVKITPQDQSSKVSFSVLTPGAPAGTDTTCKLEFDSSLLPWPPSPDAVPDTTQCGSQRPGINVAPAIAPDGTIYTVSKGHFVTRYNYLIAVNPNLTLKWAASLRGRLHDGCGVLLPINAPGGCRTGAHLGVDPGTNEPGPGRVVDDGTASPTVTPDGSVVIGTYTRYNWAQGHLMKFSSTGQFQGAYAFGWDVTPGIYSHGTTYSIVTKDNHYGDTGSYCDDETVCPSDRTATHPNYPEAYFITQLSPSMGVEWSWRNTNTLSCTRASNGSVTCTSDHPNGFEFCVNVMAIAGDGTVFVNSEDGNTYAILQGGTLRDHIFQQLALGAAYTPASIGGDGKIYSQNAGHLFVLGN